MSYEIVNERLGPAYLPPAAPPAPVVVPATTGELIDAFDEPATALFTKRALPWSLWLGVMKLGGGQLATSNTARAVLDTGAADGEVETVISLGTFDTGLILRAVDRNNFLRLTLTPGKWVLQATLAGATSVVSSGPSPAQRPELVTLGVGCYGPTLSIKLNGVIVDVVQCSLLLTGTQFGLIATSLGARAWTRFRFSGVGSTPQPVPVPAPVEETRPRLQVSPSTPFPSGPLRVNPFNLGTPNADTKDYWSDSGQVGYVPTVAGDPGLGATRHFAYYRGVFATAPLWDAYRVGNPDPTTKWESYIAANGGPLHGVVATARSVNTTGNDVFVLWETGLITCASTQTGHGKVPWPCLRLPATKVPQDLALTSNNELALVAVTDTVRNVGQLAVIMLEGAGIPQHTFSEMGLPNQPGCSGMKLLGFVDLPVSRSLRCSAACNGHWGGPSATAGLTLGQITLGLDSTTGIPLTAAELAERRGHHASLNPGGAWEGTIATAGYAVVTSREENSAVVVDLSPMFKFIRTSWISSPENYRATRLARGPADEQWPPTFSTRPDLLPTIITSLSLTRPVSVICGHSVDRWSIDRFKFHVGLEAGELVICDASPIMARATWHKRGPAVAELGRAFVGRNPIGLAFSRRDEGDGLSIFPDTRHRGDGLNSVMYVACRQDRKVVGVVTLDGKLAILRTFEDERLQDPVAVVTCVRGYVVLVTDFNGKQLVGFRVGDITDRRVTPNITYPPLGNGFEISGFLPIPGYPFTITSENVN